MATPENMIQQALEDMIQQAAKRGELSHLSVICDFKGVFRASYRGANEGHYRHTEADNPVDAMKEALKGVRKTRTAKPDNELEEWEK